jgi:hypothetical protein
MDTATNLLFVSQSRSHVTDDSQSVCRGVEQALGLVIRYYFLSKGCCLKVAVLLFLWRILFPSE